ETLGVLVFPGTSTCWHYDDKIGQKYLLETVGAPLIASHVFYEEQTALEWLHTAQFPVVWKLRGGAGSQNVRLIKNIGKARAIVRRSFGRGWRATRLHPLRERLWKFRHRPGVRTFMDIGRGLARAVRP